MSALDDDLVALCAKWRARARVYVFQAELAEAKVEIIQFTAMATTLNGAADELVTCIEPSAPMPRCN
jgi:hypothetical protein